MRRFATTVAPRKALFASLRFASSVASAELTKEIFEQDGVLVPRAAAVPPRIVQFQDCSSATAPSAAGGVLL